MLKEHKTLSLAKVSVLKWLLLLLLLLVLRFGTWIDEHLSLFLEEVLEVEQLRHDPAELVTRDRTGHRVFPTRHHDDSPKPNRSNEPRQVEIESVVLAREMHFRNDGAGAVHRLVASRASEHGVSVVRSGRSERVVVTLRGRSRRNIRVERRWRKGRTAGRQYTLRGRALLLLLGREDKSWFTTVEEEGSRGPLGNLVVLDRLRAGQNQAGACGLHFGVEGEEGLDDVVVRTVIFDQELAQVIDWSKL